MRVLVPFKDVDGRPYGSPVISGGIEKFIRTLDLLPGVEVVEIVGKNYEQTMLVDLVRKIERERPDLVICNYPNPYFNLILSERVDVPIMWICAHTAGFAPDFLEVVKRMRAFLERPRNSLWMISRHQMRRWLKIDPLLSIRGVIKYDFVAGSRAERPTYDAVTVGRCEPAKDPFRLHRIAGGSSMRTMVMTNRIYGRYFLKNRDWSFPRLTCWDLPHERVMTYMRLANSYLSTWSGETFGITALEALSLGLRVVMFGDEEGRHASTELLVDPSFGSVVSTNEEAVEALMERGDRTRIAELTCEQFSFESWREGITRAMERAAT